MELFDFNFYLKPLPYGKGEVSYLSVLLGGKNISSTTERRVASSLQLCIYIYTALRYGHDPKVGF